MSAGLITGDETPSLKFLCRSKNVQALLCTKRSLNPHFSFMDFNLWHSLFSPLSMHFSDTRWASAVVPIRFTPTMPRHLQSNWQGQRRGLWPQAVRGTHLFQCPAKHAKPQATEQTDKSTLILLEDVFCQTTLCLLSVHSYKRYLALIMCELQCHDPRFFCCWAWHLRDDP